MFDRRLDSRRSWALHAALFSIMLVVSSSAMGATITIEFTGIASIVATTLRDGSIDVGSSVSGSVSFSTNPGPNTYPNPGIGRYEYIDDQTPISSFDITIGSYSAAITTGSPPVPSGHRIEVRDDYPFVLQDGLFVAANVTGDSINGLTPQSVQFALVSTDLSRLSDIGIPSVDEIEGFLVSEGTESSNFLSFGGADTIRWNLTGFDVSIIPEPSTALLLSFGLAALGLSRRHRAR
jgi:hypothetical protein